MTGVPPRVAPDFLFSQGVPAPCFVLDEARLDENAAVLDSVQKRTGARILLALKAFSAWALFPRLSRALRGPLWGTCASSVDEARLGREEFGGEVHAFAAAFDEADIRELLGLADHITFNSLAQWRRFLDYELTALPGRAFLRLEEFRKKFPVEAKEYAEAGRKLEKTPDIKKLVELVKFAKQAKDMRAFRAEQKDKKAKFAKMIEGAISKYASLKESEDPRVAQEAKNAIADLLWTQAAL